MNTWIVVYSYENHYADGGIDKTFQIFHEEQKAIETFEKIKNEDDIIEIYLTSVIR